MKNVFGVNGALTLVGGLIVTTVLVKIAMFTGNCYMAGYNLGKELNK